MDSVDRIEVSDTLRQEYRKLLLQALSFSIKFFKRHNLHYVACGGTVLGAIRHKGLIPWDDDIDLYMPRNDYEKLLRLNDELNSEGYEVISHYNDGYYLPFAKIVNKNTTIWERKELPFVFGVFVDVFPLDFFDDTVAEITSIQNKGYALFSKYVSTLYKYSFGDLITSLFNLSKSELINIFESFFVSAFRKRRLKAFNDFLEIYKNGTGDKCVCITQWAGKVFKREWFEDTIEVPFEGMDIVIPSDYDDYLKLLYGDYMTLPPIENRVSQHFLYYVNLKERIKIEDIRSLK